MAAAAAMPTECEAYLTHTVTVLGLLPTGMERVLSQHDLVYCKQQMDQTFGFSSLDLSDCQLETEPTPEDRVNHMHCRTVFSAPSARKRMSQVPQAD